MNRRFAILLLAGVTLALAPCACWVVYLVTNMTDLSLRDPPINTIIGESVNHITPYFNTQMSHHPAYVAIFGRNDNTTVAPLADVSLQNFFTRFSNDAYASFFGPYITTLESEFNVPSGALTLLVQNGNDIEATVFKIDNNMTAMDQRRIIAWIKDYVANYVDTHPDLARLYQVHVTGFGVMTDSLKEVLFLNLVTAGCTGIVLAAFLSTLATLLAQARSAADVLQHLHAFTDHSRAISASLLEAGESAQVTGAVAIYSTSRVLAGGFLFILASTITATSIGMASMWIVAYATLVSSLAPVLAVVLLIPLSTLLSAISFHNFIMPRDPSFDERIVRDLREERKRRLAHLRGLTDDGAVSASEHHSDDDEELDEISDWSSFTLELARARRVYADVLAPVFIQIYLVAILLLSALWLSGVQCVATCGSAVLVATVVHALAFCYLAPVAAAVLFPRCFMNKAAFHSPLVLWLLRHEEGRLHRWTSFTPYTISVVTRPQACFAFARFMFAFGCLAFATWICVSAHGSVAFFPQVPRDAESVIYGRKLLNALGAAQTGRYHLVFQAPIPGGVFDDGTFLSNANTATFIAANALNFGAGSITSITTLGIGGQNVTDIFSVLANFAFNPVYPFYWKITVDDTATIFHADLTPPFDPYSDRQPTAAQEALDEIVTTFRQLYGSQFAFVGWYGANAPTWAAKVVAVPAAIKWTSAASALAFLFGVFVWHRWGKFSPPTERYREVLGGTDARLSTESSRSKFVGWRAVRQALLSCGHSVGVCFCVGLCSALSYAAAVWLFQYGKTVAWIWPALADLDGISWLMILLMLPAVLTLSFAHEVTLWVEFHEDLTRSTTTARTLSHRSNGRSNFRGSYTTNSEGDARDDEGVLTQGTSWCVRAHLVAWFFGFITLSLSSAMMVSEMGVILAAVSVANLFVGLGFRWVFLAVLERVRVSF